MYRLQTRATRLVVAVLELSLPKSGNPLTWNHQVQQRRRMILTMILMCPSLPCPNLMLLLGIEARNPWPGVVRNLPRHRCTSHVLLPSSPQRKRHESFRQPVLHFTRGSTSKSPHQRHRRSRRSRKTCGRIMKVTGVWKVPWTTEHEGGNAL